MLSGSLRIFRVAGIDVYLHWSWLIVAFLLPEIHNQLGKQTTMAWTALEFLSLFGIVLLHEFGHALACRSVGGRADQIMLWPLGGVAFVQPPPRPGAWLWSIAAGPLVNLALVPVLFGLVVMAEQAGWPETLPQVYQYLFIMALVNLGLFIFNIIPIYPLDGGQILHALLWFVIGRVRSLQIVSVMGLVISGAALLACALIQQWWLVLVAAFMAWQSWVGWKRASVLGKLAAAERHPGFACPACGEAPPRGDFWNCTQCGQMFDPYDRNATCPRCGTQYDEMICLLCGQRSDFDDWSAQPVPVAEGSAER
ncbi:MAG: M50 family metallopeptidase [Gemmataceae bacterium]